MDKEKNTLMGDEYIAAHRRKKNWKKVVSVLGVFVVIGTIGALTLPAITLNPPECQQEEHQHSPDCYGDTQVLSCTEESLGIHRHTESCYDAENKIICHYADYVIHEHDSVCYDENGTIICTLPEIKEHLHNESCWQADEDVLVDAGHQHTSECFGASERQFVCAREESEGHTHTEVCQDDNGGYICGLEESSGHQHSDDCYQLLQKEEPICGEEERAPVTEPGEPVLICNKPEVEAHNHKQGVCYSGSDTQPGEWTCEKQEVRIHSHTETCFTTEQMVICGKTEHTHDESCTPEDGLSEEAQGQVEDVIFLIDTLSPVDDIEAEFERLAEDEAGLLAYREKTIHSVQAAFDAYDALTDAQKELVTNAEKLEAYRYLLEARDVADMIAEIENLPSVTEIEAEITRLAGDVAALTEYQTQMVASIKEVFDIYDALSEEQKSAVTNAQKLIQAMDWLGEHGYMDGGVHEVKQYTDASCTEVLENPAVSVTVQGELPIGAVVRSYPVAFQMDEKMPLFAQDITIYLADGSIYQPETPVTVTVSGLDIPAHGELDVFHDLEDEWGGMERMDYTMRDDSVTFQTESFSTYGIIDAYDLNRLGEGGNPEALQELIDSGYFNRWSNMLDGADEVDYTGMDAEALLVEGGNGEPSDVQVRERGDSNTSGTVSVSKTIQGTDVENVFDITLKVDTTTNITEVVEKPDVSVVVVMDVSYSMTDYFTGTRTTKYVAAISAAEQFIESFQANSSEKSELGFVNFNTDAMQVFNLSQCNTDTQAATLKNAVSTQTRNTVTAAGYNILTGTKIYTNMEAGLKRAQDMLAGASNEKQYIIFISDGFPTTYIQSGYNGYSPRTSRGTPGQDGVFYDAVSRRYCSYGEYYSDKAAIRARTMAESIKANGTTIYSIGIDVDGQNISDYEAGGWGYAQIDRLDTNYEVGGNGSSPYFKTWLRDKIASGYYYDGNNADQLTEAYKQILQEIKTSSTVHKWVASDPMPVGGTGSTESNIEFIGFFNQEKQLRAYPPETGLTGRGEPNAENTATFNPDRNAVSWDIRNSGYATTVDGSKTTYHYAVTYRVRLKNEMDGFVESQSYQTNGTTTLTYQEITMVDGQQTVSPEKTLEFPIPEVEGYLGELKFKKVSEDGTALSDAEFTLTHDDTKCAVCRGDGKALVGEMNEKSYTASSGQDGIVYFSGIPSGHTYELKETKAPYGYQLSDTTYTVQIAYDKVTVLENGEQTQPWNLSGSNIPEIENIPAVVLPATGGSGTYLYILSGLALMGVTMLIYSNRCKKRKGAK